MSVLQYINTKCFFFFFPTRTELPSFLGQQAAAIDNLYALLRVCRVALQHLHRDKLEVGVVTNMRVIVCCGV